MCHFLGYPSKDKVMTRDEKKIIGLIVTGS